MTTGIPPRSRSSILLEFLGSMNLAITILVAIAIASVIGTVLQQNLPYPDYIIRFGPFWHDVFRAMGLYSVYSTGWFLILLGFLLLSTSVCIYRNAPGMLREMRQFRTNVREKSLRVMRNRREWTVGQDAAGLERTIGEEWARRGYRLRREERDGQVVLAGMKGGLNRLGYLLSHVGVVVICLGALVDGNFGLRLKELSGAIQLETRDIPASEVPAISRISAGDSLSFRGSVTVPEGATAGLVFLNVRDGYLVQELPFSLELKDFRIEHYPNGQPKSFESDLVIHDPDLDEPFEHTIAVNHPLVYKGYAIYQASFGDGGSRLALRAWPLFSPQPQPLEFAATVHRHTPLQTPNGPMTLEVNDFQLFNVFPAPEDDASGRSFVNFGPSFRYTLRQPTGAAHEYVTYMAPVLQDGRLYYLSGVRGSPAEEFRYLHIPADSNGTPERFLRLHALLSDAQAVRHIATGEAARALDEASIANEPLREEVVESMVRLVNLYNQSGFTGISEHLDRSVPGDRQQQVAEAYMRILQNVLQAAYVELMAREGIAPEEFTEADSDFYDDAVNAIGALGAYQAPVYLQLTDFDHVEASGLQITRAPGQNIVYLGCVMLMVGIFFMFYISHRRLWALLIPDQAGTRVMLAGTGSRHPEEFAREFETLGSALDVRLRDDYRN